MADEDRAGGTKDADALLQVLIAHSPNAMRLALLRPLMKSFTDDRITAAASVLESRGLIAISEHPNPNLPGRAVKRFTLSDTSRYPLRETIRIGEIDFPRMLDGDRVQAEDVNGLTEAVERYNNTLESRIKDLSQELLTRYWGNVAVLLGLFVAVFALIITGAQTVTTTASGSTLHLFWRNVAALTPLAVVLLGFVAVLAWAMRRL